jgi:hypothetical protein
MSATQTTCVHSHLACSRFALATFAAGTPHGVLGSARYDRGTGWFTPPETALADRHRALSLVFRFPESRAWACYSHGADAIEPLTPLSQASLVSPHASPTFVGAAISPYVLLLVGSYGSRGAKLAKITAFAFP